jgi:PEP-CTERM motif
MRSFFRVSVLGDLMNARLLIASGFFALATSFGACAPASATLIDVIYKGVVKGADGAGLFGPAGADLTGDAFVATFNMDTSKGFPLFTATENYIHGGTAYGIESPMIKATLEINGKSATIDGSDNGSVQSFLGYPGVANQQNHQVSDATGNVNLGVINASFASVGNIPFTIDVPLDFVFTASELGWGTALFHSGNLGTGLDLTPSELIYQYPSTDGGGGAAPEPSTWAMMLLGFVGLSVFGYRRKRSFAPAVLV